MSDFENKIREANAARKLQILKGFTDIELVKGHMDFGNKKPSNSNLVQKKVTDKRGHQTTRWVKTGEDEKKKKTVTGGEEEGGAQSNKKNGGEKAPNSSGDKSVSEGKVKYDGKSKEDFLQDKKDTGARARIQAKKEEQGEPSTPEPAQNPQGEMGEEELRSYAAQLTPEQLQDFIAKNEGVEGMESQVEIAKEALGGEAGGEEGTSDEPYQTPSGDTLEQFYSLDEEGQRSVLQASMEHNIPLGAALAMVSQQGGSQEETHAKIDAAQAALDDLKSHTGHSEATGEEVGDLASNLVDAYDRLMDEEISMEEFVAMADGIDNPEKLYVQLVEALRKPAEDGYELEDYEREEQAENIMRDLGFDFEGGGEDGEEDEEEFDEEEYDQRMREEGGYDDEEDEEEFDEEAYDKAMREQGGYDDEEETQKPNKDKANSEEDGKDRLEKFQEKDDEARSKMTPEKRSELRKQWNEEGGEESWEDFLENNSESGDEEDSDEEAYKKAMEEQDEEGSDDDSEVDFENLSPSGSDLHDDLWHLKQSKQLDRGNVTNLVDEYSDKVDEKEFNALVDDFITDKKLAEAAKKYYQSYKQ